ncbi:hypothetical protein DNH61_25645 [Paenibacillus sambharensis]|uniref:DUF6385 domain-containing protein n=1 Tax=Paenibacillus sambharensis TaxID=1803190 RepID=A0A2W1LD68_9BACL|nr:DUF6385 domain-containing protein [Paenibacillus sambharensis]PZD92985.1 hypothetical protein DNH61_25645 [Paenibacillus sambharensis]
MVTFKLTLQRECQDIPPSLLKGAHCRFTDSRPKCLRNNKKTVSGNRHAKRSGSGKGSGSSRNPAATRRKRARCRCSRGNMQICRLIPGKEDIIFSLRPLKAPDTPPVIVSRCAEQQFLNIPVSGTLPLPALDSADLSTISYAVINRGSVPVSILLEISPNNQDYMVDTRSAVEPGSMNVIVPSRYLRWTRLTLSTANETSTELDVYCQTQMIDQRR